MPVDAQLQSGLESEFPSRSHAQSRVESSQLLSQSPPAVRTWQGGIEAIGLEAAAAAHLVRFQSLQSLESVQSLQPVSESQSQPEIYSEPKTIRFHLVTESRPETHPKSRPPSPSFSPSRANFQHKDLALATSPLRPSICLEDLPNEVLCRVLEFLEVNDLLSASRTSRLFRHLSLTPILTVYRLRAVRRLLPPLLASPYRPTLNDLVSKSIVLSHTSAISRRLGRSLASIRLSRQLAVRPPAQVLVDRCLMPRECVPGLTPVPVAPAIVAKKRAIERERVKDVLRHWVGDVWTGKARVKSENVRACEEKAGVGRVWRLKRFWERVSAGDTSSSPVVFDS
ncbi:hypothetical protein TD95_003979 [Thielaviopsis punctulata]|uniref:F-box domain-containing protein n=1 Tax=Thielaviopsis punctulata TaxID=72032 RepID=A0A0F4ZIN8_9PEZI|nr:hypothetical protein TD95_003979 [Thielaviopsis punctulata]